MKRNDSPGWSPDSTCDAVIFENDGSNDRNDLSELVKAQRRIALITGGYLFASVLWMLGSDHLLARLIADPTLRLHWSIDRNWLFIGVTGFFLYWLLSRLVVSFSGNRRLALSLEMVERNSERKTSNDALRLSEEQYRTTIDSMKEAIYVVDQNLKLLLFNKTFAQWCERFGVSGVAQGQELKEILRFLPPKFYQDYPEIFKLGTVASTSENNVFNGKGIDTETLKIPIIENEQTIRVLTVIRDVTEEKKLEAQFLRAQRMECIGRLASGVAHDLNNVLSPIMMGASMLHDDLPPVMREQMIVLIEEAARRGAEIVKQVLTFAQGVEGERLILKPGRLIHEIINIAGKTFPKSIHLVDQTPEQLWDIKGDSTQLHQVLLNLCVNAMDAMKEGGRLTLSAENLTVDDSYASMVPGAQPGRYVGFHVEDTGMGISRENLEKIFDPFFTTKPQGLGTGLGLSIVIGIAKSHGGFVTVDSKPAVGSRFKVYIPAVFNETVGESISDGKSELPGGHGELVLLVDDEEGVLIMAETLLTKSGYHVLTARDGIDAISLYAVNKDDIKLVITDIMMPFVDGVALVKALKNMNPEVRVIASTGQAEKSRLNEFESQGIRVFLHKPYNGKQLLTLVHQMLSVEG